MTRTPKLLLFNETGEPGGSERVVVSLAEGFRERGLDVGVLTLREGWLTETLDAKSIPRHLINSDRSMDLSLPFRIAKLIKQHDYSFLNSHLLDSNFYGSIAAKIAGIPFLGTEHGDVHHTNTRKFLSTKLRIISLLGQRVSAVSHFTANKLVESGMRESLVSCITNPAHPPRVTSGFSRTELRKQVGISEERIKHWLWIHVAIFFPVKDQLTLIRAFAKSLDLTPIKQSLAILGNGPEEERLKDEVKRLNIENSVFFLGFRDDVPDWLAASDGFILSSISEALPVSLIEASLARLAIISTNVGGVSDIIEHNSRGLLVPPADSAAMAEAMKNLVNNQKEADRFRTEAYNYANANCTLDSVLNQYSRKYNEISKKDAPKFPIKDLA